MCLCARWKVKDEIQMGENEKRVRRGSSNHKKVRQKDVCACSERETDGRDEVSTQRLNI